LVLDMEPIKDAPFIIKDWNSLLLFNNHYEYIVT